MLTDLLKSLIIGALFCGAVVAFGIGFYGLVIAAPKVAMALTVLLSVTFIGACLRKKWGC